MKKSILIAAGLAAALMATGAWAGNAAYCVTREEGHFLRNNCNQDIEVIWCFGSSCSFEHGASSWTIHAGSRFTIDPSMDNEYVRWDACYGANSLKAHHSYYVDCE